MTSLTPIALFSFRRVDTTAAVLQALERCEDFSGRTIYLFCDAARSGRIDEEKEVEQVKAYLETWARGRTASCHFSRQNLGLRASIVSGVTDVLRSHDAVIVLEDDIICSRVFLRYMDLALRKYSSTENVWQISGYAPPGLLLSRTTGFLRIPACWGWATWTSKWGNYCDDAAALRQHIETSEVDRFNVEGSYDFFGDLTSNAMGRINTWNVRWYASMFLENALAACPPRSLTRNIGFDVRGSNCTESRMADYYLGQRISSRIPVLADVDYKACESVSFLNRQIRFHRWQHAVWSENTIADRIRRRLNRIVERVFPAAGR
jgi:hypothetical protein